jgi:hypothetical protein
VTTWPRRIRLSSTVVGVGLAVSSGLLPAAGADAVEPEALFTMHDPRIVESSSLVVSSVDPGLAYTANDSGDGADIYTIDMNTGDTVAVTTLAGVDPTDAEAMAPGPGGTLYFADIGDNSATRRTVTVYWIDQPTATDATVEPHSATMVYPGGARDAETLLVDPSSGRLYLVSKELFGGTIFAAPSRLSTDHTNRLQPVGTAPSLVTDGTFLPSGQVVLRTYTSAVVYDPSSWTALSSTTLPEQPQGESIAALPGPAEVLVGSEGVDSAVYEVRLNLDAQFSDDQPTRVPVRPGETPPLTGSGGSVVPPATGAAPDISADRSEIDESLTAPILLVSGLIAAAVTIALARRRSTRR